MSNRTLPKSSHRPSTNQPQPLNEDNYVTNSPTNEDIRRHTRAGTSRDRNPTASSMPRSYRRGRLNGDEGLSEDDRRCLLSPAQSVRLYNSRTAPRGDLMSQSTNSHRSVQRRPSHSGSSHHNSEPDIRNEIHNPFIEYLEVDSSDEEAVPEIVDVIEVSTNQDRPVEPRKRCRWIYIHRWKIVCFMILYILFLATAGFGVSLYNFKNIPQEFAQDCAEIQNMNQKSSGIHYIYVDGNKIPVYCDMDTDGGGWMVIQRRVDGSTDFHKSFQFYHRGFGNVKRNYWFGLINLYKLTNRKKYTLRIDMKDFDDNSFNVTYDVFSVGSHGTSHRLTIGGYSGGIAGEAMSCNNEMTFVTYDRPARNQCADRLQGGWWYSRNNSNCGCSNLNGYYYNTNQNRIDGIWWHTQKNLRHVEMKIRPYET